MALQLTAAGFRVGSAAIMLCCFFCDQLKVIGYLHLEWRKIGKPVRHHTGRTLSRQRIFGLQGWLSSFKAKLFSWLTVVSGPISPRQILYVYFELKRRGSSNAYLPPNWLPSLLLTIPAHACFTAGVSASCYLWYCVGTSLGEDRQ